MPIEAIVEPTWQVEMYSVMWSSWRRASFAPRSPCSEASSRREWRERTSEYSAITKNAFRKTSPAAARTSSQFTACRGRGYFEEVRAGGQGGGDVAAQAPRRAGKGPEGGGIGGDGSALLLGAQ